MLDFFFVSDGFSSGPLVPKSVKMSLHLLDIISIDSRIFPGFISPWEIDPKETLNISSKVYKVLKTGLTSS